LLPFGSESFVIRLLSRNIKVKIYKTIILPVVLYGFETYSLTLREEHRLRVFENRVLRRIFGPKRDEVTGEWRRLHNEELHNLYSSPDIIRQIKSRRMRWAGHVARMGEERNVYKVLMGKPGGKRPLRRPRRRWEDGIRMDLREISWGVQIGSSWLRTGPVAGSCEYGDEPSSSGATELVSYYSVCVGEDEKGFERYFRTPYFKTLLSRHSFREIGENGKKPQNNR
jgi:hypothetical protein